jgi:membrane-associated phospholipid phosphatase
MNKKLLIGLATLLAALAVAACGDDDTVGGAAEGDIEVAESGPVEGALGWAYALTLGLALVYLGEHYVVDLLAGAALTESIRRAAPRVAPAARALSAALQRLERAARA